MIITRLEVRDFGRFYGTQTLTLGTGVYVFHGRNGLGKTTLLNAVRWGLYGHYSDRQGRNVPSEVMLNRAASREGQRQFSVELQLMDDSDRYVLRRTQVVGQPSPPSELYVERNDQPLNAIDKQRAIQRLLNEDVSRFFLFDGEQLQQYESLLLHEDTQSQVIKQSIEQILGLPVLEQSLEDLHEVRAELGRKLARQAQADSRSQQHALRAQQLQGELDAKQGDLRDLDGLIGEARATITRQDSFLQQYESSMAQVQQLDRLDGELQSLSERRREVVTLRSGSLDRLWLDVLDAAVTDRRATLASEQANREALVASRVRHDLASHSLAQGSCELCRSPLETATREHLEALASSANPIDPEGQGQELLPMLRSITAVGQIAQVQRFDESLADLDARVVVARQEAARLRAALQALPTQQVSAAALERDAAMSEVGRLNELRRNLEAEIGEKSTALRRAEQSIRNAGSSVEPHLAPALDHVDALLRTFEAAKAAFRDELRGVIERDASIAFAELTTEPSYTRLRINDSYGLEILDHSGEVVTGRSAGQEQVVALALIAALNKNASRRAPVIMDTPFGRLDPLHRENVLRFSARMAEQVFFLVHGGEVTVDDLRVLQGQISAEFELAYQDADRTLLVGRSDL